MDQSTDYTDPPTAIGSPVVKVTLQDRRFSDPLTMDISSPAERARWVNASFLAEGDDGHLQALWQLLRVFFSSESGKVDGPRIQDLHSKELELRQASKELEEHGSGPHQQELVQHYAEEADRAGRRYAAMLWMADHVFEEAPRLQDSVADHPLSEMVTPFAFEGEENMLNLIQGAVFALPGHSSSMTRLPVFRSR